MIQINETREKSDQLFCLTESIRRVILKLITRGIFTGSAIMIHVLPRFILFLLRNLEFMKSLNSRLHVQTILF